MDNDGRSRGWVQVIRGPKPPSQPWPQVQGSRQFGAGNRPNQTKMESQNVGRGRWGNKSPVVQDKISSLEAALSGLGPEEIVAKEPLQEALRRAKEVSQPVRGDPDSRKAEAVAKVDRLQKALDALGSLQGPEVDAIKKALVKAQDVARTTRFRTDQRVQGVHGAFHQAHQVGVGGRDRIVGAESRQVGEVGSSTSSSGQRFCGWRWSPGVVIATDGFPVASRTRFFVPGVAPRRPCGADLRMSTTSHQCQIKHRMSNSG